MSNNQVDPNGPTSPRCPTPPACTRQNSTYSFHSNSGIDNEKQLTTAQTIQEHLCHHRIFTWVPTEEGEENVEIREAEVASKHGVPRQVLMKSIRSQIDHEDAFLTLPWALLLVIAFAVCLIGHDRTDDLRDLEKAVDVDLHENAVFAYSTPYNMAHKDVHDAHSISDVFSWLRLGLAPLLFAANKTWSELPENAHPWPDTPLTQAQKKSYLQYNRLIGGARLSQIRVEPSACINQKLAGVYDMPCTQPSQATNIDLSIQPEYLDVVNAKPQYDPKLTRWFLLDEEREFIEIRMRQLEMSDWIDNSTVHVAVHFLTYNAHFNSITLTGAHFFFARTGHIWKKIVHSGAFLDPYEQVWLIVFDVIFVGIVLRLFAVELLDVFRAFKNRHPGSGAEWFIDYVNAWNVVDWISIGLSIAISIVWAEFVHKMNGLQEKLFDVSTLETRFHEYSDTQHTIANLEGLLDELLSNFESVYEHQHSFRILASLFPIILMLRLFKAFGSQPRLALVTQTLRVAFTDVAHFVVVFFSIYSTFVVMGIALFGREMYEFSTFPRAFNTCFLVLMGEFEFYDQMFAEARQMGPVWFWMFQAVLVLVMLNMLLAIIMDTYTEVKGASSYTETLPEQLGNLIRQWQWIRRGEGLSLRTIDKKLEEIYGVMKDRDLKAVSLTYKWDESEMISVKGFADMIDGIEFDQAEALVIQAVRGWRYEHLDPLSLTEAMNLVSVIHHILRDQTRTINENHQELVAQTQEVHEILGNQRKSAKKDSEYKASQKTTENGSEGDLGGNHSALGIRIGTLESDLKTTNQKLDKLQLGLNKTNENLGKTNEKIDRLAEILLRMEGRQTRVTWDHVDL